MSRKRAGVTKRTAGPDSSVLRYLRSIDAKLDRLNKRLDNFLSAPKGKRRRTAARIPKRTVAFGTEKAAEEYLKTHPIDADDDVMIVITGVPRANDD